MGDKSNIEWTDATWNPIRARHRATGKVGWHCEHATTGCEFCYSEGFNKRLGTGLPFKPGHRKDIELFLCDQTLTQPMRWKRPRMIFVCSMTDVFADFVRDEWLDRMFAVMALCPQHTFQVLTKRAGRMREYFAGVMADKSLGLNRLGIAAVATGLHGPAGEIPSWPLTNVWLGVSTERQQEADERIPHLLQTPAAVRFISAEPLLGPIDLTSLRNHASLGEGQPWLNAVGSHGRGYVYQGVDTCSVSGLDWVIVGGESGRNARPMHPDWPRSLRDQCAAAEVSFFFKQWGEHAPKWSFGDGAGDSGFGDVPEFDGFERVGKTRAGRKLDGREYNDMPRNAMRVAA